MRELGAGLYQCPAPGLNVHVTVNGGISEAPLHY